MIYRPRQLAASLAHARENFPAVLVTGPRQSGKTTFLRKELKDLCRYVSLDDPLQRQFALQDPNGFLDGFIDEPAILDEIQHVPALLPSIKLRIDAAPDRLGWWTMSGSQQFEVMQGIGESLAGRVAVLELLPFSHAEVTSWRQRSVADTLWEGGYPGVVLRPSARDLWLRSYVATYLERDVRNVLHVRDLHAFETVLSLAAARHGQELHYADIARACGMSEPTVKQWIGVLEASCLVRRLQPYHENFGKRITKATKLYFLDSGLVACLTRQPSAESLWAGAMGGAFFEGMLVAEACKTFASAPRPANLYYWRSHDGTEVDLLVQVGSRVYPVELKQTASPSPGHLEPALRLRAIMGEQRCAPCTLVCCVKTRTAMPHRCTAIPWQEFSAWLRSLVDDTPSQGRAHT